MTNKLIFEYSAWFVLVSILVSLIYAFLLYFRDEKLSELSKKKIILLASLRFFSVLLISLLLLSPLLKTISKKIEKPIIIFAIDNSKSIKLASDNNPDFKNFGNYIKNVSEDLESDYNVKIFSFDSEIYDTLSFDFSGQKTNISNVIEQINDKYYNKNIGALIIASDGIYNSGTNPLFQIGNLNYAVYTVGLGDTTKYQDVFIKKVLNNEIAFLNNEFPVSINIGAKKLKGENAEIKVFFGREIVFSKNINITNNDFLTKINLYLKAEKIGIQEYRVVVKIDKKERNILNNSKNFAIKVLKNKQKILILGNSPTPDISALQNSLKTNSNFEINVDYINNFSGNINDYSLVILHNLPSKKNPAVKLFNNLKKYKIPLMIVVGMQTDLNLFNSQNLGLQFSHITGLYDDVQGDINPNFKDFEISENINKLINSCPPLKVPFVNFSYAPQIKVVLNQKIKGLKTEKPLVLLSNGNVNYSSNIIFILGENFWRLRIYDFRNNDNFNLFDEFVQQLAQYAVLKSKKNRFIVKVDKIIPENNEIIFKAEVYDKIYQLVNENDVNLVLIDSVGNKYDYLFDKNMNSFSLNIGSFPAGHYNYIAKTEYDNKEMENKGSFVVVPIDLESQDLVANHDLLKKLSVTTGGKFFYPENLDSLKSIIENDQNIVSVSYSFQDITEIITEKWLFFIILLILTVEWGLRKFFGTY